MNLVQDELDTEQAASHAHRLAQSQSLNLFSPNSD